MFLLNRNCVGWMMSSQGLFTYEENYSRWMQAPITSDAVPPSGQPKLPSFGIKNTGSVLPLLVLGQQLLTKVCPHLPQVKCTSTQASSSINRTAAGGGRGPCTTIPFHDEYICKLSFSLYFVFHPNNEVE